LSDRTNCCPPKEAVFLKTQFLPFVILLLRANFVYMLSTAK